ncbi:methyltransferase [Prochlorococcus sp. MIT 0801]|uniref:methyltransferase n=1 Tax=Prochlorococcus sp. MIT 0801 TaxID=1501269 RepID=UPI0004F8FEA3|nr:methyltransferase [Prochlorococcus sp. MIT 0801]AIQ96632.1 O-antigen biosynthesis protein rfbC [Prochlorococcus sp. MIT 0801]
MENFLNNSFLNYRNNEILSRIPLNSKVVLEVGCGDGSLGFNFKNKNPLVEYIGIESSVNKGKIAKEKLDKVFICDIEDYSIWIDKLPQLDCVIYSNILQQVNDPTRLVKKQTDLLKKDAVLITLFSNINHWSFLKRFFNESDLISQVLCESEFVKRITPENISSIFNLTPFRLFDISAISSLSDKQECNEFIESLDSSLTNLGVDREKFFTRISPSFYISRFTHISKKNHQQINVLLGDMDIQGVSDSRIIVPYKSISTNPNFEVNISNTFILNKEITEFPKIVIISRPIHLRNENDINKIKKLINNNYLIIIDYDDDPNIIPKRYSGWDFTFTSAHAIQTSNLFLANYLKQFNPEVQVFNNTVSQIGEIRNSINTTYLKIFFGAINRKRDWQPWMRSLNNIANKYPSRLFFEVIHDLDFYNSLEVDSSHKRFTPTCDYPTYLDIMKECDICFLPLCNNHFNQCKSDLKAVEAASFGLALISSPTVYSENFRDGIEALFFEDSESLCNILTNFILEPHKVREIGKTAQEYVKNNRLFSYQLDSRIDWYQQLWSKRSKLTKDIYDREPILLNYT